MENLYPIVNTNKPRIIAIDILKVFAVLVVLNSHMEVAYGKWDVLATGGAIGDALFFFCSGFMLFRGPSLRFDNFMKRRISRIYPTVIIVAIVGALLFGRKDSILQIIISGGGWFVSCIFLYYTVLWIIKRYGLNYLKYIWITLSVVIIAIYYFLFDNEGSVSMYGANYFKWVFFFTAMLQGAQMGLEPSKYTYDNKVILKLIFCIIVWYGFMIGQHSFKILVDLQYLSLIPLLGITYYFYLLCRAKFWQKLYEHRIIGQIIFIIGGLCLECYLVQGFFITDKLNRIFPLNLILLVTFILFFSYIVNFFSSALAATFRNEDYNWREYILKK